MRQKKILTKDEQEEKAKAKKKYLRNWYENMKKNETEEEAAERRAKHNEAQKKYIKKQNLKNDVKPRNTLLQTKWLEDKRKLEDKLKNLESILVYTLHFDAEKELDELVHTLRHSNERLRSFIEKINK